MRRLIILSLMAALILALRGRAAETNRGKVFGIYLVTGAVDPKLRQGQGDWQKLPILSEPIISEQELVSYDWASHHLTLDPAVITNLLPVHSVQGLPFIVTASGERIYFGVFNGVVSSSSFAIPAIVLSAGDSNGLAIARAYPTGAFGKGEDPRSDERIKTALMQAGKLNRQSTVTPFHPVRSTLSVTTNDVIRIERPGVGVSLIQFTELHGGLGRYRWRFHSPGNTTEGVGYWNNRFSIGPALKSAGKIEFWWYSYLAPGQLTFDPSREKAELLPASAYDAPW